MDNDNMALWHLVEKTDPAHVKAITGKSYSGTSPKPHYLVMKATETFGPIGIGWGFNIVEERIEDTGNGKLSIARVRVWYKWKGERGEVEHVGGTEFSGVRKSGSAFSDEDAPKKSVTDALVKALSMIGFAGDIFIGRYDDSKYVAELKEEVATAKRQAAAQSKVPPPNVDALLHGIGLMENGDDLKAWAAENKAGIDALDDIAKARVRGAYAERQKALAGGAAA